MSVVFFNTTDAEVESDSSAAGIVTTNSQGQSEAQVALANFWSKITDDIRKIRTLDLKNQALPLARIKKIMKLDDDVKMISAEAPMLFAKAAEIFIHELTLRAWIHTEDNKRRTLQRNDIAMAITKFDQFDFLIDIVPRDEIKPNKSRDDPNSRTSMNADQVHYYFQLAQQHQAALQQTSQPATTAVAQPAATAAVPTIQIVQQATGQVQTVSVTPQPVEQAPTSTATATVATTSSIVTAQPVQVTQASSAQQQQQQQATAQVIQLQQPTQAAAPAQAPQQGGIQIVQQIVTPTGEIQQIPIHLTPSQLQLIRMQVQSGSGQPIIIQTAPIQAIQQTTAQPQIIQAVSLATDDQLNAQQNSQL